MLTKEKIQKVLQNLPDNPDIEIVIEKLILLDKIQKGKNDVSNENVFTGEQIREELKIWLK